LEHESRVEKWKNEKRKSSGLEKDRKHISHPRRGLSTFSKKQMRGFNYPLTIVPYTLFILLGWSWNSNSLPDEPFHVAGFGGEDFGVLGLSAPLMDEPVFCYRRIVVLSEPNLPMVLLQPGLHRTVDLSDIHLAALEGTLHISGSGVCSPKSSLHRTEETDGLPGRQAITFDVAFGQRSTMRLRIVWICGNVFYLRW
jgi:hypothetical protein